MTPARRRCRRYPPLAATTEVEALVVVNGIPELATLSLLALAAAAPMRTRR